MTRRPVDSGDPDRLYTVTQGRTRADESGFDLVTLIVAECDPAPGMQSEHVKILRMCERPTAVVEIAAEIGLPIGVVKILLCDLLDTGRITARHPRKAPRKAELPDTETLRQVLVGLHNL